MKRNTKKKRKNKEDYNDGFYQKDEKLTSKSKGAIAFLSTSTIVLLFTLIMLSPFLISKVSNCQKAPMTSQMSQNSNKDYSFSSVTSKSPEAKAVESSIIFSSNIESSINSKLEQNFTQSSHSSIEYNSSIEASNETFESNDVSLKDSDNDSSSQMSSSEKLESSVISNDFSNIVEEETSIATVEPSITVDDISVSKVGENNISVNIYGTFKHASDEYILSDISVQTDVGNPIIESYSTSENLVTLNVSYFDCSGNIKIVMEDFIYHGNLNDL